MRRSARVRHARGLYDQESEEMPEEEMSEESEEAPALEYAPASSDESSDSDEETVERWCVFDLDSFAKFTHVYLQFLLYVYISFMQG